MDPTAKSPKTDAITSIIQTSNKYLPISKNIKSALNILKKPKSKTSSFKPTSIDKLIPLHLISVKTKTGSPIPILALSKALSMSALSWMMLAKSPTLAILQNIIIVKSILDVANAVSLESIDVKTETKETQPQQETRQELIRSQERISKFAFIMSNFANMLSSSTKPIKIAPGISSTLSYMLLTSSINNETKIKEKMPGSIVNSILALSEATGYKNKKHIFKDISNLKEIIPLKNISIKSSKHQLSDMLSIINRELSELSLMISSETNLVDITISENTVENINKNILSKLKSELLNLSIKEEVVLKNEFIKQKISSIKDLIEKAEFHVSATIEAQESHDDNKNTKEIIYSIAKTTNKTKQLDHIKTKPLPFENLITMQSHIISVVPQNIDIMNEIETNKEESEAEHEEEHEEREKEEDRREEQEDEEKDKDDEKNKEKDIYSSSSVIKWQFGKKTKEQ